MEDQEHVQCKQNEDSPVAVTFPLWAVKTEPGADGVLKLEMVEDCSGSQQEMVDNSVLKLEMVEDCSGSQQDMVDNAVTRKVCTQSGSSDFEEINPPYNSGHPKYVKVEQDVTCKVESRSLPSDIDSLLVTNSSPSLIATSEKPSSSANVQSNTSIAAQSKFAIVKEFDYEKTMYQCGVCSVTYSTWPKMDEHLKLHEGTRLISCKYCSQCFFSDLDLSTHLQTHFGDTRFRCTQCDKCFIRKNYLLQHLQEHDSPPNRPHKCVRCGNSYTSDVDLRLHLKSHSRLSMDRVRKETCSSRFVRPSKMKCLECRVCRKYFLDSNDLSSHMLTHSNNSS